MDERFGGLLGTLREARSVVQSELDRVTRADILNRQALQRLRGSVAELVGQAESLVAVMQVRKAEEAMLREAEELCEYFDATAEQVAFLLAPGIGRA